MMALLFEARLDLFMNQAVSSVCERRFGPHAGKGWSSLL